MDAGFACNKKTQLLRLNQSQTPGGRVKKKDVACRTMTLNYAHPDMGVAWRNVSNHPTWNKYGFVLCLATLQEGNTSFKMHNWLSSLASEGSVINSARAGLGAEKVCMLAYRRWFASTSYSCFLRAFFFLLLLRYLDTFRPCIPPLSPYSQAALLGYCSVTQ